MAHRRPWRRKERGENVDSPSQPFRVIGRRTPKVDAIDKVTGRAQFGADVALPRVLVGKVSRSPYAHARIRRIDTSKAAALPGVLAIITGKDLPAVRPGTPRGSGSATAREYYLSHEVLARAKVLFHGHAVAATSSDIAERALDLIQVDYDVLPHVLDPLQAMRPEAVLLHAGLYTQTATGKAAIPSNIAEHLEMGRGVDRDTGQVKILRYTTFQDVGRCVNPDQVEGQMQGGATQGIGWALSEGYAFDDTGAVQNARLLDYRLPSSLDVPYIATHVIEVPSSDHPYGIRAVGQVPIVPPAAALANAIYRATGVRMRELPMTPERLYWAMKDDARGSLT
jgi:CO/xanthine dehydrogenase Mo-binding subunit